MKTKSLLVLFALAATATAAPLFGEKQAPPEAGKPKGFSVPAPHKFTLDNGMAVTLVEYGTLPKVTVRLAVRTGNIDEKAGEVWLSDVTGDLLSQGTETRTAAQIAEAAARMGGELNVNVGEDRTDLSGDVLSEFGPEMAALIADVAIHPKFPESELARLKGDRQRQLSIAKSQPQQMASEKFRALLYGDHPYGRLFPTDEILKGFTIEQVRAFYEANFGAARAHLYAAGKFDAKAMEASIRKAFSGWKRGSAPSVNLPKPRNEHRLETVDRPGAVQSTIYLGMPVTDPSSPDGVALGVMNSLLGGSFGSRITSNIREQKGYTYSPNSQVSTRYRDGYWVETADVTTKDTGASLKEILAEIKRLQTEPPSAQELKGIQNFLAGTFVLQNSSRAGIIAQLAFVDLHGLPAEYLNTYVSRVYAVTPAEVQQIAAKYIQSDKATIVVVGDKKVIAEQIAPYEKAL
ncbi:MAG TPA: pitrilysin family protein [Thermoanaerobaculia bacterium]|nr:pitrilysin family protein [Thermoanaerobaculia bacterium]